MEQKMLNTLIDDTLCYLQELKVESPYVMTDTPYVAPKITSIRPTPAPTILVQKPIEPLAPMPQMRVPQAEEPVQKPQPPQKIAPTPTFIPNPPKSVHKDPMQDLRTILSKIAPSLTLHATAPNDAQAKRIKNAWKEQSNVPDIVILATPSPSLAFLHHVAKAIELHFFSSRVIDVKQLEEKNNWEAFLKTPNLKMIISPDGVVWSCKQLMRYYHEFPNKKERFLGTVPLLLLPDPSLYLKDPTLKRSLWNLLCQMLKPLQQ